MEKTRKFNEKQNQWLKDNEIKLHIYGFHGKTYLNHFQKKMKNKIKNKNKKKMDIYLKLFAFFAWNLLNMLTDNPSKLFARSLISEFSS